MLTAAIATTTIRAVRRTTGHSSIAVTTYTPWFGSARKRTKHATTRRRIDSAATVANRMLAAALQDKRSLDAEVAQDGEFPMRALCDRIPSHNWL
jgi:hypothetical protein